MYAVSGQLTLKSRGWNTANPRLRTNGLVCASGRPLCGGPAETFPKPSPTPRKTSTAGEGTTYHGGEASTTARRLPLGPAGLAMANP